MIRKFSKATKYMKAESRREMYGSLYEVIRIKHTFEKKLPF